MTCKSLSIVVAFWSVSFTVHASSFDFLKRYMASKAEWIQNPAANLSGKDQLNANDAGEDETGEASSHRSLVMLGTAVSTQQSNLASPIQPVTGKKEIAEEIRFGQNIRLQRKSVAIPIGQQRKLSQTGIRLSWHFGR